MHKLLRYFKPYGFAILVTFVLLFAQANLDLALPEYLSKIVNTGLQDRGVELQLPDTIRATTLGQIDTALAAAGLRVPADLFSGSTSSVAGDTVLSLNRGTAAAALADQRFAAAFPAALSAVLEREGKLAPAFDRNSAEPAALRQVAVESVLAEYAAQGLDVATVQTGYILRTGGIMLLLTIMSAVTTILVGYLASRIAAGATRTIRGDLFAKVESFSLGEFDKFSTASLITRSTNDLTQVQMASFLILRMVVFAPIVGIGGVIRAVNQAPDMAWIIGLAVMMILLAVLTSVALAMPRFKLIQKLVDALNRISREQLTGLLVVRAFNRQSFEQDRFERANTDVTKTSLFVMRVMTVLMPFLMLAMYLMQTVIVWIAAPQIAASNLQVGDMMAFIGYAMQIFFSFLMLSMVFIQLPRASVSASRIAEVLSTEPEIRDPDNPVELPAKVSGRLEFRDVQFRYPGATDPALQDVSFTAEPGTVTGIIGPTGSGKSSLLSLIPRLYDPEGGEVLLDGIPINRLRPIDLRRQVGYVPQKALLFSGSLRENLALANEEASDDELLEAAKTAQAADFIQARDQKLDADVAQGGGNFSGGQKQRLSIARALTREFPVLVFDDTFSALDARTDANLRKALAARTTNQTVIISTQRVSTIMQADQILVLDDGKVVGKGTHESLLKDCPPYKEIVQSQLGTRESA